MFSFIPSLRVIEPDSRQVICFLGKVWVRKPGLKIIWPFWLAEQNDVNMAHSLIEGHWVVDGKMRGWEATIEVINPVAYIYNSLGDEDDNALLKSTITRQLIKDEEPDLEYYGVEIIHLLETHNGIPVIHLES